MCRGYPLPLRCVGSIGKLCLSGCARACRRRGCTICAWLILSLHAVQGQQMASSIFAAEPEPASAPSVMSEAKRKALYSTSVFAEAPETSAAPKVSDGKV